MESEISTAVSLYKDISRTPVLSSAYIVPTNSEKHVAVISLWSAQDYVTEKRTRFSRLYSVEKCSLKSMIIGNCVPLSTDGDSCGSANSHSGLKQAVIVQKKSPDELFLEIWGMKGKEKTFNLTDNKDIARIYTKDLFGCLKFSSDEKHVLFIAEKKPSKGVSFFKDTPPKTGEEGTSGKGEEYLYREEWGEGFSEYHHTVLCTLEIESGKIEVLPIDTLMDTEVSVSQAAWGPNDETVVFVAWEENPYRLGIWACMNRRSSLCSFNLKTRKIEFLRKEKNTCVYSPRFSPNLDVLVFLENESDGPHKRGAKLQKIDWETKKLSTVVDIIHNPVGNSFPGIYTCEFPAECWSADGNHFLFSTSWRSKMAAVSVNINDGSVRRIDGDAYGCCSVLSVRDDIIIASADSPDIKPHLLIGRLNEMGLVQEWKILGQDTPERIPDLKWDIHTLCPSDKNPKFPDLDYEIIVISPTETKKNNPLIMIPHGGPHSCYPATFSYKLWGFVKLGYIACIINYRGSIGFGEDNLNSLPGNIGSQDVSDVHNAAIYVKEKCNYDIGDIFLYGGSHGGFLGAHLSGQYPDFYRGTILRNPVIDLSSMVSVSDIPDWCWVESGCRTRMKPDEVIKPEHLKAMWEKSPIKYAENVKTPTLLLLGKDDVRVPKAQGLKYYQFLKAKNVPVKVFMYDDNHVLSRISADGDGFIQTVLWLKMYASPEK